MKYCPAISTVHAGVSVWLSALALALVPHAPAATLPVPTPVQIARIAALLPEKPTGVGAPIDDRTAWAEAAKQPVFQKQVADAEKYAGEPTPEYDAEELLAEEIKTGKRDVYEIPYRKRTIRLLAFTIAECVQDQGKYLPLIEAEVAAILAEKTWGVSPQPPEHPAGGMEALIDLGVSCRAWDLATVDYWLAHRLKPATRQAIKESLRRRVLDGYASSAKEGKPAWWWMTAPTNWNPVCTSGVLGTALTTIESREERAFFVQAALNSLDCFTGPFPDDGYCAEGPDYWGYGFGTFLTAAETLYQQTHGKINLYAGPNTRRMALFMRHWEIVPGVYPAFGDANPRIRNAPPSLMSLINRRWNMGWPDLDPAKSEMFVQHPLGDRLSSLGLFGFPWPDYGPAGAPAAPEEKNSEAKRTFFRDASVLICRSVQPGRPPFGVAIKGGKNGGPHSHTDNGSYVVASGDVPLVVDPGMEKYNTKTFSSQRYESMMMNSYGHSLPYVGKTLQKTGPDSEGKIISTEFTDDQDTLKMDLTSGYPVPGMKRLTRTYVFNRVAPSLEVIDEAEFSAPTDYGGAVVTLSDWRENGPGSFLLSEKGNAVAVTVTVEGAGSEVQIENKPEPITGFQLFANFHPMRLGVNLNKPVTHLLMRTRVVPAAPPTGAR